VRKSCNTLLFFLSMGIFFMLVFPQGASASYFDQSALYENTTDFMCGISKDNNGSSAQYDISITFFNPHEFPIMVNNLILLSDLYGMSMPPLTERYLNVLISPGRTFELSCNYIKELFFPQLKESPSAWQFNGHLRSRTARLLDMVMQFSSESIPSGL